jgi:predicted TIM-barrel fold metal-dependent hydrolase
MAAWLNDWSAEFAQAHPQVLQSATFFPEPEAPAYVAEALDRGARVFKVHVQVGAFDPRSPLLDPVWARLEAEGTPVVIHCGSGPLRGEHTGPAPMSGLLERHPRLQLVIAHLGMPEYGAFLDLAERYERVHLDTTMFATDFTEQLMPFDPADRPRLVDLRDKILLGSDFPSIPYPYAHQLAALHRLDLGEEWLRAVLWENGARLFGVVS